MKQLCAFLVALFALSIASAEMFRLAADSSSGTYKQMAEQIIGVCGNDEFNIVVAVGVSGGAPGNLDALVNNKADGAFMHSDVFLANSMSDPNMAKYQTLVALYPEQIHVLALKESKTKKPGLTSFGKLQFNSLDELKGLDFKVGAAGGGVFTAKILQGQGQGGFSVEQFDKGDDVIAALAAGSIDAAIFVGAAPLPNMQKLDKAKFKLIRIGIDIESRVASVYKSATVSYPGLTSGPVKTLAPLAVIQTKKYSTPAKIAMQRHFRDCFYAKLPELKDTGTANWDSVEVGEHGVLPWYEIPAVAGGRK